MCIYIYIYIYMKHITLSFHSQIVGTEMPAVCAKQCNIYARNKNEKVLNVKVTLLLLDAGSGK